MEHAERAVEEYRRYIERLLSVHKTASPPTDWARLANGNPPAPPERARTHEYAARHALNTFTPSVFDRLFGRSDSKLAALRNRIRSAIARDEDEYQERKKQYHEEVEQLNNMKEHAKQVLRDWDARLAVLLETNPFKDIAELGSSMRFETNGDMLSAFVRVHSQDIIPDQEFGQYVSGKLALLKLPRSKYYALYQDHVCSVVLRIAREINALLPLDVFLVTAEDELLNSATGHTELQPILSVYVSRSTLQSLDFQRVDPSDAMRNFVHNMNFKASQGFKPVSVVVRPKKAQHRNVG